MTIQFNTDKNIHGSEALEQTVADKVKHGLKHYTDHITRVEVHLTDQNADKGGAADIQCKMEARISGMQPIIATGKHSEKEVAVDEAIDKLKASMRTIIGKVRDQK
jgi:ribosomal subunit interface protein